MTEQAKAFETHELDDELFNEDDAAYAKETEKESADKSAKESVQDTVKESDEKHADVEVKQEAVPEPGPQKSDSKETELPHEAEEAHTQENKNTTAETKESSERGKEYQAEHERQQSKKEQEEAQKSIAEQLRNMLRRILARIKRVVDRFIGRNQIPNWFHAKAVDFANIRSSRSSKDEREPSDIDKNEKEGRNWRDLMYHGFARRVLGKDAYMYAVKQGERENTSEPKEKPFTKDRADGAARMDAGEVRSQTTGKEAQNEQAPVNRTETKETTKTEPTQSDVVKEEMKGKFNSLHKMITADLEDRYTNAAELKDTFFKNYCRMLESEFEKITGKDNIKVSHERENGILRIKIADAKDQFGEYVNLRGVTKISIEMDSHLNVQKAEGIVIDRMSPEGKIQSSRTVDLRESLGKYAVSKLAKNFREDYNTSDRAFNVTSRNEFINELANALKNKDQEIQLDNIIYSISADEKNVTLKSDHSEKTFEIDLAFIQKDERKEELLAKNLEKEKEFLSGMEKQRDELEKELKEKINIEREAETLVGNLKASKQMIQNKQRILENDIRKGKSEPEDILAMKKELDGVEKQLKDNYKEIRKAEQSYAIAKAERDIHEKNYKEMSNRILEQREKIENLEASMEANKANKANPETQKALDELHKDHVTSVSYERKVIIRSVEELLPNMKSENSHSDIGLEEFNHIAENTKTLYNDLMREEHDNMKPELFKDTKISEITTEIRKEEQADVSIEMGDVGDTEIGSER